MHASVYKQHTTVLSNINPTCLLLHNISRTQRLYMSKRYCMYEVKINVQSRDNFDRGSWISKWELKVGQSTVFITFNYKWGNSLWQINYLLVRMQLKILPFIIFWIRSNFDIKINNFNAFCALSRQILLSANSAQNFF